MLTVMPVLGVTNNLLQGGLPPEPFVQGAESFKFRLASVSGLVI